MNGPFHLVNLNKFLGNNFLTRDETMANSVTREEFKHTDGKLFDSRTGGFGRVVVETDSTGWKYIGDGWNNVIPFEDIVVTVGRNLGDNVHVHQPPVSMHKLRLAKVNQILIGQAYREKSTGNFTYLD